MKKENQRQDQVREHITKHSQDYRISLQCQQHTVAFTFVPKWLPKNHCYSMELDLGCTVDPFRRLILRLQAMRADKMELPYSWHCQEQDGNLKRADLMI
jgi:hypothetical protein